MFRTSRSFRQTSNRSPLATVNANLICNAAPPGYSSDFDSSDAIHRNISDEVAARLENAREFRGCRVAYEIGIYRF